MKKLLKQIYSGIGMGCFTFVAALFIGPVFAHPKVPEVRC